MRFGDAFIGAGSTSSGPVCRAGTSIIRRFLDEAGRDPASYPIAKRVYIGIDEHKDRAGEKLAEWFTINYGAGRSRCTSKSRSGARRTSARAALRKVVASGAEMLVLTALFDEAEQLERIADLAPRLDD